MAPEKVYICMLGRSTWALINTYYAVLRETGYRPDSIVVILEEPYGSEYEKVRIGLSILSEAFGCAPEVEPILVAEADMIDAVKKITAVFWEKKDAGAEIAIDITPGRKAVVAGTLLPLRITDVDYVFYLSVSPLEDVAKPYLMIPLQYQTLHEFKEEALREWEHGR